LPGRLAHAIDGLEQPHAQCTLDPRHAPPDGGLVDPQPRAGAGVSALVPDRCDDAKIVPVHRPSYHAPRNTCNIAAIRCKIPAQKQADIPLYLGRDISSGRFPASWPHLDLSYRITVDADSRPTRDLPDGRGGSIAAATIHEVALAELSDRFAIIARGDNALI
jgi:hypothetical protein